MPDVSWLKPQSSQGWLAWVLLFFVVFFSLTSDQFLTWQNLLDLADTYAVTGIFALGLFVVLNPATPVSYIHHYIHLLDKITVMTVDPGYAGQPFIPEMVRKIEELRDLKARHG